jgi:phosphoribosylglycinamide formyltransferase-1
MSRCRVVVLISGRGSNLAAIADSARADGAPFEIAAVISNRPDATGLDVARRHGTPALIIDHHNYRERALFDRALIEAIDSYRPDLVALAGFMRVLGDEFIEHYAGRLLNIHPSLLPAFPGLRTHERAIESGVSRHGATVHFVTRDVDGGPIIIQAEVPVLPGDTPKTLAVRVLEQEHRIYPIAIHWFATGRLTTKNRRVYLDNKPITEADSRDNGSARA